MVKQQKQYEKSINITSLQEKKKNRIRWFTKKK